MSIYTEKPSIFFPNPRFPLVKFTFSRHSERFETPNIKMNLIEIPKSHFKDTHREKTQLSKSKSRKMGTWIVDTSNQLFIRGS